jgi:NAD(P)-dependent dehydrogenase (short-subunit alcohol dehydrogenase family)
MVEQRMRDKTALVTAATSNIGRAIAAAFAAQGGVVRAPVENDPAAAMMRGTPYGAFGTPDAIARAAVNLGSEESKFVNGTVINVDAGRTGVAVIVRRPASGRRVSHLGNPASGGSRDPPLAQPHLRRPPNSGSSPSTAC